MSPVFALDGPTRFYGNLFSAPRGVLLLGAGDGALATALVEHGHEVWAVEGSPALLALAAQRKTTLAQPERLTLVAEDPRTFRLGRAFDLVLAPHQALGVAKSPDELHAFLSAMALHLAPEGVFGLDALHDPVADDFHRSRMSPYLRERAGGRRAWVPLRLSAQTVDDALASVGLQARERLRTSTEGSFLHKACCNWSLAVTALNHVKESLDTECWCRRVFETGGLPRSGRPISSC